MASCKYCGLGRRVNRDGEGHKLRWEMTRSGWRLFDPHTQSYHLCRKSSENKLTIVSYPF